MKWLLYEAYYKNKYGVIGVIISSSMALFFQVSVFMLSMMYFRALGHKEHVIKILGYEFFSTKDHWLTVCVIFYIITALTVSALLDYYTQGKATHVAQDFENKYLKVIIKYLSKCSFENFNRLTWVDSPATLERLMDADLKACGRIVRSLFLLLLPVTIFCFSICCLLYLSFELTLILGLLVLGGFCIHLFMSHWSVKNIVLLERNKFEHRKLRSILVENIVSGNQDKSQVLEKEFLSLYEQDHHYSKIKDKITEKSRLVTRILNALLLSIVVLSFVTEFEKGFISIVDIIFYVLVLRYCMSSLLNAISIINRMSSALPGARRVQQVSVAFKNMSDVEEPIPV